MVAFLALFAAALAIPRLLSHRTAARSRLTAWGQPRARVRNLDTIAAYHRRVSEAAGVAVSVDDRTWADLDMDAVYAHVDRTDSLVGQQVLYARLRATISPAEVSTFDALTTRLADDEVLRTTARRALVRLGDRADGADLLDLVGARVLDARSWYAVFPAIGLTMGGALAAVAVWPVAVFGVLGGALVNLGLRATVARHLGIAGRAFRQIQPLLTAADALMPLDEAGTTAATDGLRRDTRALSALRRIAAWVGRDGRAAVAGDLWGLLVEYLNLLFCLDGNALYFGGRHLRAQGDALLRVVGIVGTIDAAMSTADYRAGAARWTRPVFGSLDSPLSVSAVGHPLIANAVTNTVMLRPPHGVIVTGSNMSGKSTFLRTLGVSVLLAQSIATCEAASYEAPWLVVRSCIGRRDDLVAGTSYYLAEVDSVLDLVSAAQSSRPHLLLFDELFRGTNAVERIAAGEAVLWTLLQPEEDRRNAHVVVAATHDLELVDHLTGRYVPFHFSDRIEADRLTFDYCLVPGAATTRNALALMRLRGAPERLVARAMVRAANLERRRGGAGDRETVS